MEFNSILKQPRGILAVYGQVAGSGVIISFFLTTANSPDDICPYYGFSIDGAASLQSW